MGVSTRLMCGISGLAVALLATTAADAQSAAAASAKPENGSESSQEGGSTLSEVVVVADKRHDALINVPVAASALTYTQLQQYGTNDLTSIASQLPQVQLLATGGATSGAAFSIRGVGSLAIDYSNEQPVALVIDGVPLTRGHAIDLGAFDVSQVQVLEGPQALFYGKNSPAGVVALSTVSPGKVLEGYARAGYETETEMPFGEAAVSLPITDTLAVRLAFRYSDMTSGAVKNLAKPLADPFPGETSFTLPGASESNRSQAQSALGRFTAVWRPTDSFDATLKFAASDYRDNGQAELAGVSTCAAGNSHPSTSDLLAPTFTFQDPFAPCTLKNGEISNGNAPREVTSHFKGGPADGQPFTSDRIYFTSVNLNYRVGDVTLTSVTGYYDATQSGYDNYDLTVYAQALDAQPVDHAGIFSQELRAASNFSGPLNFNAGGFYEFEDHHIENTSKIFPLGPFAGPGPFNGMYNTLYTTAHGRNESYSFFGQLKWAITPTLELAGGARWSHDDKITAQVTNFNRLESIFVGPLAAFDPFAPAGRVFHTSNSENNLSPEFTLTWRPRRGLTLYGAYKEGYLAGGASTPASLNNYDVLCAKDPKCTDPGSLLLYRPETAKGGEVGAKGTFFEGSLYADLSIYRYEFSNLQVTSFDSTTTSFFTRNAASALSQGVEAKFRYNATAALQIHGYAAYTNLAFESYADAQCYTGQTATTGCVGGTQNLSGKSYGGPPWDFNLGANYRYSLPSNWALGLAGDLYCHTRAPRALDNPNDPGGAAFCTENASLRLSPDNGPWEFALIGTNLSGEYHVLTSATGKPLGAPGDLEALVSPAGRTLTLQATYRF